MSVVLRQCERGRNVSFSKQTYYKALMHSTNLALIPCLPKGGRSTTHARRFGHNTRGSHRTTQAITMYIYLNVTIEDQREVELSPLHISRSRYLALLR